MESIEQGFKEIKRQRNLFQALHASNTTARPVSGADLSSEKPRHLQLKDRGYAWRLSRIAAVLTSALVAWLFASGQDTARVVSDVIFGTAKEITTSTTPGMHEFYDTAQRVETPPLSVTGQNPGVASNEKSPRHTDVRGTAGLHDTRINASAATATSGSLNRHGRAMPVIPASTTLHTDFVVAGKSSIQKPQRIVAGNNVGNGRQAPLYDEQPAANAQTEGQWVVNLVSVSNKAYADLFMEEARTRNIDTEQQQVTVNGKQYWRVQIGGLSTAAEAREIAGTAKERLGLKDAWITTR